MQSLKKLFIAVLAFLTVALYLPRMTFAQEVQLYAKASITEHAPKSRTTPEKDIPMIQEKKKSGWTWLILIALLGGVAAAGGGGGGGGGGGTTTTTGDVTVGW